MTAIVEPIAKPLCARCRTNPVLGAMSICKVCLRRQADGERAQREQRMRQMTQERRLERRHARPLGRQDK